MASDYLFIILRFDMLDVWSLLLVFMFGILHFARLGIILYFSDILTVPRVWAFWSHFDYVFVDALS